MLKPRPENMPAIRASTPNLFSTRTEIVCRMEDVGRSEWRRWEETWPPSPRGKFQGVSGSVWAPRPNWWTARDSNPRPPRCKRDALTTELAVRAGGGDKQA